MMRRPSRQILVLWLVVLIVFGSVCGHEFLDYDDAVNIYANAEITNFSPANLLRFWQKPYLNLYIPLTYNLWSLLSKVSAYLPGGAASGPSSALFHGVNLLLHLASATLVFSILKQLFTKPWAACAGAVLFAIHPVQAEAVSWATGLKDVLSGFFALFAVWQYLIYASLSVDALRLSTLRLCRSVPRKRNWWPYAHYLLATAFFGLALLSKPSTVITPLVAGAIATLVLDRRPGRVLLEMLPWLLLTAPIIWMTGSAQTKQFNVFIPTLWQRLLVCGDTFSFYLGKLVLPLTLGPDYGRTPQFVLEHGWIYLTGSLPYVLAALLLCKASRPLLAAASVFAGVLLPVSGLMPFVFQQISTVADRYLYLAMLGPALALAWWLSRLKAPRPVWVLVCVALTFFGVKSLLQTRHWKTPLDFYAQALRVNPRSWTSYNNLGNLKTDMNLLDEAIAAYEKAVAVDPGYADAYNNLGVARALNKQPEAAIEAFTRAMESNPLYVEAALNLGDVYRDSGQSAEAIGVYQWAVNADPSSVKAYKNLCALLLAGQNNEEAAACYNKLLTLTPDSPEIYNNLGTIYKDLNQNDEAVAAYRQALALRPGFAEVYNNLGFLYAAEKKYGEAISFYQKAVEILPNHPKPMHNLALTYQAVGQNGEAINWLQKAIAVDGAFAPAYNDLSRVYLEMGQYDLAVEYGERARELGFVDLEQLRAIEPYRQPKE